MVRLQDPHGQVSNLNQSKIRKKTSLRLLGTIALIASLSGAAMSFMMSATPLQGLHPSVHLNQAPTQVNLDQPINILILGIDNSGHPHVGGYSPKEGLAGNSDTMLVVRLTPEHEMTILSIPRDTLVEMSDGVNKINNANPRGGIELAAQTVSRLLNGAPIDRYIRIDTESFTEVVNALGGVEVDIPKPMNYEDHSQHLSIHFHSGKQILNGQHLQEYVRFRHDELGDIGRVQRQQVVLKDLLRTFLRPATITRLPQIISVLQKNVDTDLSIGEMLNLSAAIAQVDRHHQTMVMLPGRFSRPDEYRLSYWVPNTDRIATLAARYFGSTTSPDAQVMVPRKETLRVAITNATSDPDIGKKAAQILIHQGFSEVYFTDHDVDVSAESAATTQIIAEHGNPEAANLVEQAIGVGQVQTASTGDLYSDVTVIVGADLMDRLHQL